MKTLQDYPDPFQAILDFESALSEFTGAPYCVTVDSCTHALEIALRLTHRDQLVALPAYTYISVVMLMHKLNIPYTLLDEHWRDCYNIRNTQIWDCARYLEPDMYKAGQIQCLSFNRKKPLELGRGGCLLTDDIDIYKAASMMRSDGRDLFSFTSWIEQKTFRLGFHYTLRPEECIHGLNVLSRKKFVPQLDEYFDYPDCRKIQILS